MTTKINGGGISYSKLLQGNYGFIGTEPDTLYHFNNGKYTQFEGTEIVADCVKARVKDLKVEGKTIQDTEDLANIESVAEKENNILALKVNDVVSSVELPIPLRSLPNGVCDTIEGDKVVQRVGKVVADGTETIVKEIGFNRCQMTIPNCKKEKARNPIISDKFRYIQNSSKDYTAFSHGGNIFFYLGLSTEQEYVEWVATNKPTFYYELETPIIHDITIPPLATAKGTNIITTENNIKPNLNLKVKVK